MLIFHLDGYVMCSACPFWPHGHALYLVEEPILVLTAPWKWDGPTSWGSIWRLLSGKPSAIEEAVRREEPPSRESGQIFFVYDTKLCVNEEDDPNDAIVYFYPPETSVTERCNLCCQLVGMAHFFSETFSMPNIVTLENGKIAMRLLDSYVLALTGPSDMHNYVLQEQMDFLLDLFKFYHGDFMSMKEGCYSEWQFLRSQKDFWDCSLPVSNSYVDEVSRMFRTVNVLRLSAAASEVYSKGYKLLQRFQEHSSVLAGSMFYRNMVLASQLTQKVTQMVQLAATARSMFAIEDIEVRFRLPPGIRLVHVYVSREDIEAVRKINANPEEAAGTALAKQCGQRKSSSDSVSGCNASPARSLDAHTDSGHRTEGRSGSASDVSFPQSLPVSMKEVQDDVSPSGGTVMDVHCVADSDFLSDFDSDKDLKSKTEMRVPSLLYELKKLSEDCLVLSQEKLRQQHLRNKLHRRSRRRPRKEKLLPASPLSQKADANCNTQKASYNADVHTMHDYYDGDSLALLLARQEGFPVFSHQDVSTALGGLPVDNGVDNPESNRNSKKQSRTIRIGTAFLKLRRIGSALKVASTRSPTFTARGTEAKNGLVRKKSRSVYSHDDDLDFVTGDDALAYEFNSLPPVVPLQLLALGDTELATTSTQAAKHEHENPDPSNWNPRPDSEGGSRHPSTLCSCTSSRRRLSVGQEFGDDVHKLVLYVQNHCDMVCVALLEVEKELDQELIKSLWAIGLAELGGIEAEVKTDQQSAERQGQAREEDSPTLFFNKQLHTFGDATSPALYKRLSTIHALGSLHRDLQVDDSLERVSIRPHGEWIRGSQTDFQETYRLSAGRGAAFLSPEEFRRRHSI